MQSMTDLTAGLFREQAATKANLATIADVALKIKAERDDLREAARRVLHSEGIPGKRLSDAMHYLRLVLARVDGRTQDGTSEER